MQPAYLQDKDFENVDFTVSALPGGEYANCSFVNCNFSDTDFAALEFTECRFIRCNLSLVKLNKTLLDNIHFEDCKITGVNFEHCNHFVFSVQFEQCNLSYASFYKRQLKKTIFNNCNLQECDFTEADISGSVFTNCNFEGAKFDHTNLEKADLSSSHNYSIDPLKNKLKNAVFSAPGVYGLLDTFGIKIK